MPDGYGFLRSSDYNYLSSPDDIYVSTQQVKSYGLKTGDVVDCHVRPPHDGEKYFPLTSIDMINGRNPNEIRDRVAFEHLTPLFPDEKFNLCGDRATTNLSTRIVDLFSPIGKGQRALIVAQPKTGKTILMKDIANAIAANHPEAYLMMLLIDERPEEVTDMARRSDSVNIRRACRTPRQDCWNSTRESQTYGRVWTRRRDIPRLDNTSGTRIQYRFACIGQGAYRWCRRKRFAEAQAILWRST